ncbi:MAG: tetratricopeptide repeat protein [Mobilitalea sp.]
MNSKLIYILVFLGAIVFSLMKNGLNLSSSQEWAVNIIGIILLIIVFAPYTIQLLKFQKKYASILPILQVDKDPGRFIKELEKALMSIKDGKIKNSFEISLAAGYCENGEYEKAHKALLSVNSKSISPILKGVYYNNLYAILFNLGEEEKAIKVIESNQALFRRYENHPALGTAYAINMVYRYLAESQIDQAKLYYEKAVKLGDIPYMNDMLDYLKADILFHETNYEGSMKIVNRLKESKLVPSLKVKVITLEQKLSKVYI